MLRNVRSVTSYPATDYRCTSSGVTSVALVAIDPLENRLFTMRPRTRMMKILLVADAQDLPATVLSAHTRKASFAPRPLCFMAAWPPAPSFA